MAADSPTDVRLTATQLRILAALCRPIASGNHFATPATNQEIAEKVFLSVDAVKGHLRTLYRKFGIEDLAHNQKRARLVELAIAGGYVEASEEDKAAVQDRAAALARAAALDRDEDAGEEPEPADGGAGAPPGSGPATGEDSERSLWPYATFAILILVVIGGTLSISGIFNQSSPAPARPTPAAYRTEVAGYCRLALAGASTPAGESRADRARADLEVIETMRGRLESLVQPGVPDIALERFGTGLTNAANYTSDVAAHPPAAGSAAEAKAVAELTFAAGQVQAGALGYGLGHECLAIGELIARSAQNAAAP